MARKTKTMVDTTVPLGRKVKDSLMAEGDCFGKLLDLETRDCQVCADNELCTLLFKDVVDKKSAEYQSRRGPTLDLADLSLIDKKALYADLRKHSGEITVKEILERIREESRLTDDVSLVEWIKRFKEEKKFSVKGGVVYV